MKNKIRRTYHTIIVIDGNLYDYHIELLQSAISQSISKVPLKFPNNFICISTLLINLILHPNQSLVEYDTVHTKLLQPNSLINST